MLHVDEKANAVEKLKQLIASFIDHRPPIVGGCPVLNTAVDTDDGNPALRDRVQKALRSWRLKLQSIVKQGVAAGDIRADADPKSVAILIIAGLEGALMMSRLDRNDDAQRRVQAHLNHYLHTEVASAAATLAKR